MQKIRSGGTIQFFVRGMKSFNIFLLLSVDILVENAVSVNLSIHLQAGASFNFTKFPNFRFSLDHFAAMFSGLRILKGLG